MALLQLITIFAWCVLLLIAVAVVMKVSVRSLELLFPILLLTIYDTRSFGFYVKAGSPFSSSISGSQVMFDLDLTFSENIFVDATLIKWGRRLPVELTDLTLGASLRVVMRNFVPVYPCFRTLDVALMKPLQLDFGLSVCYLSSSFNGAR